MKVKQKKGISLIVLVITIIVMIILASSIILSLNGDNVIEKANEAKNDSDYANFMEAYEVAELELMFKGDYTQKDVINKVYPNISNKDDFAEIYDEIVYIGEDEKLKEALSDKGISSMEPEIYDYANEMDASLILYNGYMTGLGYKHEDGYGMLYTANELITKLPKGSRVVKLENGEYKDLEGTDVVGTGNIILDSNDNHIAYTVVFGDLDGNGKFGALDALIVDRIYGDDYEDTGTGTYEAADANDDGYITEEDDELILKVGTSKTDENGNYYYIDQHRPVRLNLKW